jgi:tetratricopeptide (TPR) repeat protein
MYDAMTRTQPRNATGPLGQALARIDRGDDAGAREALARAAAIDSARYEIPLYRAGIALRGGRPEEAIALAREAGARVGWNRDARLIEALALQQLGRWPEARPVLENLRARSADDADVRDAWRAQLAGESRATDRARAPRVP